MVFAENELAKIDRKYFSILQKDCYDVTVKSKNTGHYWRLHSPEYMDFGECIIFHKHFKGCAFHRHGHANSLGHAIRMIRSHDRYQIEVRGG